MDLRVLGPLEATEAGATVKLAGRRARQVLAVLAAAAGTPVSTERLIDAVWENEPPGSARTQVSIQISRLRGAFTTAGAGAAEEVIETTEGGYRLRPDSVRLDAAEAERALTDARTAPAQQAAALLRSALSSWRGRPYEDVPLAALEPTIHRLEELRFRIVETLYDLELELGRYAEVVGELTVLVEEAPLREHLRAQLINALWRAGRRAEALDRYREGRTALVQELGIEPGPELRQLQQQILADPQGAEPTRQVVPSELPRRSTAFSGRAGELARLIELVRPDPTELDTVRQDTAPPDMAQAGRAGPPMVATVSGPGGIGKSALALQVAHRVAEDFPDGRIYVDLCGSTPHVEPVTPLDALARMMRSLGATESTVPRNLDEAAARFRSLTEGRRLLLLLDNALDAAQVEPLLPASPGCRVLVTARRPLTRLAGAAHLQLEELAESDGLAMLGGLITDSRLDRAAALDVLQLCDRLPLAISIAAARLNSRPAWTLRTLADRLLGESRRLTELETEDRAVRAGFEISYRQLGGAQRRLFGLLSLPECVDIGVPVAAAIADLAPERTEALLESLVDVQLVDSLAPGRYRMHDLVRLYAREALTAQTTADERAEAVRRGIRCYLATARTACVLLNTDAVWRTEIEPRIGNRYAIELRDRDEVYRWLNVESANLPGVFRQAAALPDDGPRLVGAFCCAVSLALTLRGRATDKVTLGELALAVAPAGDEALQAIGHDCIGSALLRFGDREQALRHLRRARLGFRRSGEQAGEAVQLAAIATALRLLGRYTEAIEHSALAIEINRRIGRKTALVDCLTSLGLTYRRTGDVDTEIATHREAAIIAESLEEPNWLANVLANLGEATRLAGRPAEALAVFADARVASGHSERTETFLDAEICWGLGRAYADLGDPDQARVSRGESARILHELGLIGADERHAIDNSSAPPTPEVILRNT